MEKHSKDYLRDTLVKLQAMQNSKNNAPQVYLQGRLFLLIYTAPAVHEAPRRGANGAWLVGRELAHREMLSLFLLYGASRP